VHAALLLATLTACGPSEARVAALEGELASMKTTTEVNRVSTLEGEVAELKGRIAALENTVTDLHAAMLARAPVQPATLASPGTSVAAMLLSAFSQEPGAAKVTQIRRKASQVTGFQLSGVPAGSGLSEAGLRSGDIITAINGKEMRNTIAAVSTLKSASRDGGTLQISLRRDGQPLSLTFSVP